jgi:hypothetical protein
MTKEANMNEEPKPLGVSLDGYIMHECESCHKVKPCQFEADPYDEEINGIKTPIWICRDCFHEHLMDI